VKLLLLQNDCYLINSMNGLRFPCLIKSGNAKFSALHHCVPDLHRKMLLVTLWNTYFCINDSLALTLIDFSLVPPHPYRQSFTLTAFR
jgi:hypothetical protein